MPDGPMSQPHFPHWSTGQTRRAFLRGLSGGLALPWLGSLTLRADSGKRTRAADKQGPPRRFACVYFSNGVEPQHWWARGAGESMRLGPALEPLTPHRQQLVILNGLFNAQAVANPSAHLGRMPNLLSGAWVSLDQSDIRVGRSMDQLLAQRLGHQTALPSLVLGVEPTELRLEDGLSMIYGSCISWATATRPATKEIYPARAFDQIVGNRRARALDRSILDQVAVDARALRGQISADDRRKLDEYLESVRGIEKRIDRAGRDGRLEGRKNARGAFTPPKRPGEALPQDVPDHMRLILDMIVLAFRLDRTRIATCMLNNDLSQMNFGFLPGVQGSLHLDLTHNGRDPKLEAMYLKTNQYHAQQFAYLLRQLQAIEEAGGTLLDHSLLLFCSNLFDGDKHEAEKMPFVLAGGGGGTLRTGRVIDVRKRPEKERRACSLYLSLMDRMGVRVPRFGDTSQRLGPL